MPETKEPYVKIISPRVKVLYGYRDGHAKLEVLAPIGILVPVNLTIEEIKKIKAAFDEAYIWAMLDEIDRKKGKGDQERVLDPRGKVVFGFPDGHAVIAVRVVPKFSPWLPLDITRSEILEGKPSMDEVYTWALLPQEVREMQGVA
jgi:hypothetical protein